MDYRMADVDGIRAAPGDSAHSSRAHRLADWPCRSGGGGAGSGRHATGQRKHAEAIVACDFCVVVTATCRVLYVFVMMQVGRRQLVHVNGTSHPTAAWTLQQFREVLASPHAYRFVLHDRDSIYAPELDAAVAAMGVRGLRTPVRAPNAVCERPLGTLRRECLDFLIPVGEAHLRRILRARGECTTTEPPSHVSARASRTPDHRPSASA